MNEREIETRKNKCSESRLDFNIQTEWKVSPPFVLVLVFSIETEAARGRPSSLKLLQFRGNTFYHPNELFIQVPEFRNSFEFE
jgi:hypothetical protein